MTDTNYTPDEIRLLDEFANSAMLQGVKSKECYDLAADMIAERRKRVQSPKTTVDLGAVVTPLGTTITPQPEQQPSGELTEEAVNIKLTDEVLNKLDHALVNSWQMDRLQFIDAIRTLRDRARAVSNSSMDPAHPPTHYAVSFSAMRALREVLP